MKLYMNNITKEFQLNNEIIKVLTNINLEIHSGEITSIVGNSGSGKSTLLNIMGLIDRASSGSYYIGNKEISNNKERLQYRAENIGFIFQQYNLIPNLSSFDNVKIPLYLNNNIQKGERVKVVQSMFDLVGLSHRMNHFPKTMSGGEQQRVAIARALINNPEIILADEPTGNVDFENETIILELFKKLANEGKMVIVVTHSENVKKYSDKVYKLVNGTLEEIK